jgi:hypothetical protein
LNDAIAAGSFKPAAQPCCLLNRRKGTDKNSIVGALRTEIRAANDQLAAAKLVGVFRLQRRERGLSIAFVALRRNLNRITTAYDTRSYRRWAVRFGRCDGDGSHMRAARGSRDVCLTRLASALGRNGNGSSRPPNQVLAHVYDYSSYAFAAAAIEHLPAQASLPATAVPQPPSRRYHPDTTRRSYSLALMLAWQHSTTSSSHEGNKTPGILRYHSA